MPQAVLDAVREWQETPEVLTKEQVLKDEFGAAAALGGSISGAVRIQLECS